MKDMDFLRNMIEASMINEYEEGSKKLEQLLNDLFEAVKDTCMVDETMSKERNECRKAFVELNYINIILKSKKLSENKKDMAILGKYIILVGNKLMEGNNE